MVIARLSVVFTKVEMNMLSRIIMVLMAAVTLLGTTDTAWASGLDYAALRAANAGKKAEMINTVDTTEKSVIFTFGGFSRQSAVADILNRMSENSMHGTFFVTERELKRNADTVQMIVDHGQELGIGVVTNKDMDFAQVCDEISRCQEIMHQRYGVKPKFVRQMYKDGSDDLQEAVSAMGCVLVGQSLNVVQARDKDAASSDDIMPLIFGAKHISMARGQIAYIRTDFYTNEKLAGDMMMAIKKAKIDNVVYRTPLDTPEINPDNDTSYSIQGIGEVYDNTKYRYSYPVTEDMMPVELRPETKEGAVDNDNFGKMVRERYIGAPEVRNSRRVYEFLRGDYQYLDTTGVLRGVKDNTIFLTFDDWASDRSLNRLLYVLRKHNVKGTFFIITWNVLNNRNMLRTIAEEGHEIASHTDGHVPMADTRNNKPGAPKVLSPEEYFQDVSSAYDKLASVVGDVKENDRYALHRYLRPPTLSISKSGIKNIFNAGYQYIVSGYESTDDFSADSRHVMIAALQHGIYQVNGKVRTGSIIIMHMTDSAQYTAETLDLLLTANEELEDGDPRKFKVGLLGDYLREGYSQYMN